MEKNVEKICALLAEKNAKDITVLNIAKKSSVANYMIVACCRSTTQVKAVAEHVENEIAKEGTEPLRKEGLSEGRWIIYDYGDVIVHIFNDETRLYYHLEELWGDDDNVIKYHGEN